MYTEEDRGLIGLIESINFENNNNQDNNGNVDEKKIGQDLQRLDTKDETDDPYLSFQDNHQNDESLDLINGIADISSNNPSIKSYQKSEVARPGLTGNSNLGTIKRNMTEVTTDKTKNQ